MADKVCPECAETVKAAAKVCKHCGHRFPEVETKAVTKAQARESGNGGAVFALIIVGLLALVSFLGSDDDNGAASIQTASADPFDDPSRQELWIIKSQDAIRKRLRDPDSAQFRDSRVYAGGSTPVVWGEVNSRNGVGGRTGFERFIASGDNPEIAFVASDVADGDSIDVAWDALCVREDRDAAYVP